MLVRKLALAAVVLVLPLSAAACSDDGDQPPKRSDLIDQLDDAGYSDAQADCIADAVLAKDFTIDEVNAANEELANGKLTSDNERTKQLLKVFTDCLAGS